MVIKHYISKTTEGERLVDFINMSKLTVVLCIRNVL